MIVFYYLLTIHIVHIEYVYQHAYVYIYIEIYTHIQSHTYVFFGVRLLFSFHGSEGRVLLQSLAIRIHRSELIHIQQVKNDVLAHVCYASL